MGGHVRIERALVLFAMLPGAENKESNRRSEPIIICWQATEAVEQLFVLLDSANHHKNCVTPPVLVPQLFACKFDIFNMKTEYIFTNLVQGKLSLFP